MIAARTSRGSGSRCRPGASFFQARAARRARGSGPGFPARSNGRQCRNAAMSFVRSSASRPLKNRSSANNTS
eukprot:11191828-Lingulodinium_polyedra.AAC.1